ncbi:hypothetical protein PIB30_018614 [Stylosanthes scabra]|uniref:Uncharacterized protein n=1 Tax=Stylosanthes scabra TaxID=79078 RepID=A0ABU6T7T7_9FABA|nr:hypothetical protein [Stylosanthes scabra]
MGGGGMRSLSSVFLLGYKLDARESWEGRVDLITNLMSSLAIGIDIHHMHLFVLFGFAFPWFFRYRSSSGKHAKLSYSPMYLEDFSKLSKLYGSWFFRCRFKLWKEREALLLSDVLEDFSKLSKLYGSWYVKWRIRDVIYINKRVEFAYNALNQEIQKCKHELEKCKNCQQIKSQVQSLKKAIEAMESTQKTTPSEFSQLSVLDTASKT